MITLANITNFKNKSQIFVNESKKKQDFKQLNSISCNNIKTSSSTTLI
jgi:hypothetical protein